jgi:serine/threonine-protein kinase
MRPGDLIADRFEILRLAGSGGMGRVYEARDHQAGGTVALKVLQEGFVNEKGRFLREGHVLAGISHPGVVRHVANGTTAEGDQYLVMEWLEGETLSERLGRAGLDIAESVALCQRLACALGAVHRAGIVHRDIKPSNVFLPQGSTAHAKLIDFGVARGPGPRLTSTGDMVGTPGYISPEQARGEPNVDARADVFSLGCVLFKCLTGHEAFTGDDPLTVLLNVVLEEPPSASELRPGIPAALDELVARLMTKSRDGRPRDGDAVAAELEALGAMPGGHATPGSRRSQRPLPGAGGPRSVAVLPLRNGGPKDDEYIADSFTEDLIHQLSMAEGLCVHPLDAVLPYKGTSREARDVGAELGVDMVVAGSVRKAGDTLRVALRAVSVAEMSQVWAQRFDRPAGNALAAADEIAAAVAEALASKPPSSTLTPKPPSSTLTDPAARDLYEQARTEYHRFENVAAGTEMPAMRTSVMNAIELFEKARARAPDDARILAGVALGCARIWFFDAEGARARVREASTRIIRVAPESGEALLARAAVSLLDGDLSAGVEDAARAIARAPDLADAHRILGRILCEAGPAARGIEHLETAAKLDPAFGPTRTNRLHVYELIGRGAEVDRLASELLRREEGWVGWASLARVILWRGDVARAKELLEHPVIKSGKAPSAREILRMLLQPDTSPSPVKMLMTSMGGITSSSCTRAFLSQMRTEFAAARGKLEDAFASLGDAVEGGLIDRVWMDGCAALRDMRADRRFAPLQARVAAHAALVQSAVHRAETSSTEIGEPRTVRMLRTHEMGGTHDPGGPGPSGHPRSG